MAYSSSNQQTANERKLFQLCKEARIALRQLETKTVLQCKWLDDFEKYTDELSEKAVGNGIEIDED